MTGISCDSYELGFAAETGWQGATEDDPSPPPFDYVESLLLARIGNIQALCLTDREPEIYITEGRTFRFDIAKRKPYKGTRLAKKPWHYNNLTVYLRDVLGATVVTGIEADDALAIRHSHSGGTTILVSRDKDLRQCPGPFYSWEIGAQPSFGPIDITPEGSLSLNDNKKKLKGTGISFLYAQILMGDPTDNIPGLPNCGPVGAFELLEGKTRDAQLEAVIRAYQEEYGIDWEEELLEQGRLCFMTRRLHPDGTPVLWEIGMTE